MLYSQDLMLILLLVILLQLILIIALVIITFKQLLTILAAARIFTSDFPSLKTLKSHGCLTMLLHVSMNTGIGLDSVADVAGAATTEQEKADTPEKWLLPMYSLICLCTAAPAPAL